MNERNLANAGPRGYAQYKGDIFMPGADSRPELPVGQGQQRETPEPRPKRAETREQKPEESPFKPGFKLQFEVASDLASQIVPIQSEQAPDDPIDPDRLKLWKQTLVDAGMDGARVMHMSTLELIVWGQRLIHVSNIEMPDGETPDIKLKRLNIEKAGDLETEERLTIGKVKQYLKVVTKRGSVEIAEETKRPKESEIESPETKRQAGTTETPKLVAHTVPYLDHLSRDQLIEAFNRSDIKLPEDWDQWGKVKRAVWLRRNHIYNISPLPQINEQEFKPPHEPEVRYEDKKVRVVYTPDEKIYMVGVTNLSQDSISSLYQKAGFEDELELPDNYDKKADYEKRNLLSERGIEVLTVAGGGTKWPDNDSVDFNEAITRLTELVDDETNMGTAAFTAAGYHTDRQELNERLLRSYADGKVNSIFSTLLNYAAGGITDAQQRAIQGHLAYLVAHTWKSKNENSNYQFVANFNKTIEDFRRRVSGANAVLFDSVITPRTREAVEGARKYIDDHFKNLEETIEATNPDALEGENGLYNVLKTNATSFRDSLRAGLYGTADRVEVDIFETVKEQKARELPGQEGLLEWHAVNLVESIRKQYATEKELGVPIDWKDSMRNVLNNLRYVESTDFPAEDLQQALGRINSISEAIPPPEKLVGSEREEAEAIQRDINEMKKAVQAVYILRTNMEGTAMTPDEIVKLFHSNIWNDRSYRMYFKRFFKDHRGNDLKDAQGQGFNLLDKAKNVIDRRFTNERRIMNQISEMTKHDLGSLPDDTLGLKQEFITRMTAKGFNLNEWGTNIVHTYEVIDEWYREKTLLGAHSIDANGEEYLEIRKAELRENLRDLLSSNGLTAEQIQEYENVGLLKQVINNAYYLNWSWGAASDYDVIAIWDRNKRWFGNRPRLGASVHNRHSDLWGGRMVDHFSKFLLEEKRGRSGRHNRELDTNYILQKHMIGKNRDFLPHNRLSVKMISDNLRYDTATANALVGGAEFGDVLADTVANLENIDKLDIGTYDFATHEWNGGDDDDRAWAEGAAIAQMVEDGVISFENIEWSKVFDNDNTNVSKFNMADWWTDRATAFKYFGPDALQTYLQTPNTEMFFAINNIQNFYSKRENRIKPWMKLVIPAHFEIGKYWRKWWKMEDNMAHSEKEQIIDYATETNRLEAAYHHEMKLRYTGWGYLPGGWIVRNARESAEAAGFFARERVLKGSWMMPVSGAGEFWKQFWKYMATDFR